MSVPYIDSISGELVFRIVYDGIGEAGKTTSIQTLSNAIASSRRGAQESPGSGGRRTEYFDWFDFQGGYFGGRRVRCQLVSVPGQAEFAVRRRHLLSDADAIVLVVDSRCHDIEEHRSSLELMRDVMVRDKEPPLGVVVQANKQDLPGALAPEDVLRTLALPSDMLVVPSVATQGDGVLQAFVHAMRLATERARAVPLEVGGDWEDSAASPKGLFDSLMVVDRAERALSDGAERENVVPADAHRALDSGLELFAGHVWPPVKGRKMLATASRGPFSPSATVVPWAPAGCFQLLSAAGYYFHSHPAWAFRLESDARHALLALVQLQLRQGALLPQGRAWFIAAGGLGYTVWMLTSPCRTLRELAVSALSSRDMAAFEQLFALARAYDNADFKADALHDIAEFDGRLAPLALVDVEHGHRASPRRRLVDELEGLSRAMTAKRRRRGAKE